MKKFVFFQFMLVFQFLFCFNSCKQPAKSIQLIKIMQVDPGFSTYIDEYSGGIIPVTSTFRIKLTPAVASSFEGKKAGIESGQLGFNGGQVRQNGVDEFAQFGHRHFRIPALGRGSTDGKDEFDSGVAEALEKDSMAYHAGCAED